MFRVVYRDVWLKVNTLLLRACAVETQKAIPTTPASFCLLSFLFFSFPTVFASNLFWCNFLYLVTTAGFVADQLIM